ncbi:MAG: alanine racemase [Candidatus Hydrogenedentes bacterium]|nr:alanine racemase [Candidatus Hydrogenedentota bacterium]
MSSLHASRVIVDGAAYRHNLDMVRQLAGPSAKIMAVIKADAYGHGLVPMARYAEQWGVGMLGVATVDEGAQLREAGLSLPVLVLVQPSRDALPAVIEHRLTLAIADVATAELLGELARKAGKVVPVHCKIDTGMGRQGFPQESAVQDIQFITRISHIDIEGLLTHFPSADLPEDPFTYNQIRSFRQILRRLDKEGIPYEMAHAANSAGIVNYRSAIFDLVRAGIMTYGVWPSVSRDGHTLLKPVMQWESTVTQVRHLDPGATVGYGRTYTTPGHMHSAIVPVGYADGYPHALSNQAEVLIQGKRCPVRGSVCMDQIVVDISALNNVRVGDPCVLLGRQDNETIAAEELAQRAGTIPYEIFTGIGARSAREYRN